MYLIRRSANLANGAKVLHHYTAYLSTLTRKPKQDAAPTDWNSKIAEAEKIVDYSTSLINLNDEMASIAVSLRKRIDTNHPLLKTTKNLLLGNESPQWGLIVLLVSKTAGLNSEFPIVDKDIRAGVLHSQRILSEVTEMIRSSHLLHKALINIDPSAAKQMDMNFGNEMSLLSGDYLLSVCCRKLAGLRNQELNESISSALRDVAEGEFIGPRDEQNRPLPAKPQLFPENIEIPDEFGSEPLEIKNILGNAKAEWTLRHVLSGASLLARSCQGSLKLAGHSDEIQKNGYRFGKHFALTTQAFRDIESVYSTNDKFSLVSAPVLFHLKHNPSLYSEIEGVANSDSDIDYKRLRDVIVQGPGLNDAGRLEREHCQEALKVLHEFPKCVLHSQRILSEVAEMVRSSYLLHKALINIDPCAAKQMDMNFGNKISLLGGDYLLSVSYRELAGLRNQELNELISSAIRDLAEGEFIGPRDEQNRPLPAKPQLRPENIEIPDEFGTEPLEIKNILGNAKAEWTLRHVLSGASLLARSCQGSLKLAGHSDEIQKNGYRFGKHFALTMQAFRDIESVCSSNDKFSLVSAPVLFHLKHNPSLYSEIETVTNSASDINYKRLRDIIIQGPGLKDAGHLEQEHCQKALRVLHEFPKCDSHFALKVILNSMQHSDLY